MKKKNRKWILLLGYVLAFPVSLQISFLIKKYVGIPLYEYVDRTLQWYQLFPIYTIMTGVLAALFIAFMIVYSRRIADMFSPGMLLPIGIVGINVVSGILMSGMQFAEMSYYFNSYDSHFFYTVLCILLILLLIDSKLHKKI